MANESKPNVLVFLCDQLRIDLLACYGETLVRTPNISALARGFLCFRAGVYALRYLLTGARQPADGALSP